MRQDANMTRLALEGALRRRGPMPGPLIVGAGHWHGVPGSLVRLFGSARTDGDLRRLRAQPGTSALSPVALHAFEEILRLPSGERFFVLRRAETAALQPHEQRQWLAAPLAASVSRRLPPAWSGLSVLRAAQRTRRLVCAVLFGVLPAAESAVHTKGFLRERLLAVAAPGWATLSHGYPIFRRAEA